MVADTICLLYRLRHMASIYPMIIALGFPVVALCGSNTGYTTFITSRTTPKQEVGFVIYDNYDGLRDLNPPFRLSLWLSKVYERRCKDSNKE